MTFITMQHYFFPIRKLSSLSWEVSFNHILREGNECVDWLTKFGTIIVETLKIWISPLAQLDIIMLTDTSGVLAP
jgi:hypothetical protein